MAAGTAATTAQELHGPLPPAATAADAPPAGASATAARNRPQLMPIAQLLAVVLGVMAIIWNQQQTTDNLRTELRTEIAAVETRLRADMAELRAEVRSEIAEVRAEVRSNGQRLARIEGFLGIGIPEDSATGASSKAIASQTGGFLGIGIPEDAATP